MLKVQATNGNSFEFDADKWMESDEGLLLFKGSDLVAQFSAYNFVQVVPEPVAQEPEAPVVEPEPQPEEPEAQQDEAAGD